MHGEGRRSVSCALLGLSDKNKELSSQANQIHRITNIYVREEGCSVPDVTDELICSTSFQSM
jgi:hypothetical protein